MASPPTASDMAAAESAGQYSALPALVSTPVCEIIVISWFMRGHQPPSAIKSSSLSNCHTSLSLSSLPDRSLSSHSKCYTATAHDSLSNHLSLSSAQFTEHKHQPATTGTSKPLLSRLFLTPDKLNSLTHGLSQVADSIKDCLNQVVSKFRRLATSASAVYYSVVLSNHHGGHARVDRGSCPP